MLQSLLLLQLRHLLDELLIIGASGSGSRQIRCGCGGGDSVLRRRTVRRRRSGRSRHHLFCRLLQSRRLRRRRRQRRRRGGTTDAGSRGCYLSRGSDRRRHQQLLLLTESGDLFQRIFGFLQRRVDVFRHALIEGFQQRHVRFQRVHFQLLSRLGWKTSLVDKF